MKCSNCQHENPEEALYCMKCGTELERKCLNCGVNNPLEALFCIKCGTTLIDGIIPWPVSEDIPSKPKTKELEAHEGERRNLTVMFCDLVRSTTLSEHLDPEELREVIRAYQEVCADVVSRFDGHIAKYMGDGLLVYFGYPQAHEDDARRAVKAGLRIVAVIRELPLQNIHLQQPLQVRIAIHTGLVVVGEMGGGGTREPMAIVGETPNIAARLLGLADPNTVVLSSATYRLVEGYFEFHDLGLHTLKGVSTLIHAYRVFAESDVQGRLDLAVTKGLTTLVGREKEIEILFEWWERVKEGEGHAVLISGEAGIGKSRLVQVLKELLKGETHTRIESRCSSYYQNSSLYPVIDHLQKMLNYKCENTSEENLKSLEEVLELYDFSLQEVVPLFASLLSLPLPDRYSPLNITPQRMKRKTLEALLTWLLKEADKQPVLRIFEDLHWVDPSTLEYINLLLDQVPKARILALLTFRPDFTPPWTLRSHMSQITLSRLTSYQVVVMIERVAGAKTLPPELVQQIVAKTDGVPLFVEELTKMVLESGFLSEGDGCYELRSPLPPLAIPATLQDSLMARLDRLSPIKSSGMVKDLVQLGATLGREFTYELLKAVSLLDETSLQRELTRLVEAELLYQSGLLPQATYFFKHALIQDAAYQSLLKSKRQHYHQKIAQILEAKFPATAETQPELLAHHYKEAGLSDDAIPYCQRAGHRAIERSANMEAISHLTKGLELLKTLPDTPEHSQRELDLQITLGPALTAIKGYAAPEVEKTYARALELCQKIGETPQLFTVLWGQWAFYAARAEHKTVLELAEQLMHLAQYQKDPAFLLEAHSVLGASLFWVGELASAREHLEEGIATYELQKHRSHAFIYGQDPGVFCLSYLSRTLWYLGFPDQALKTSHEALILARELSHTHSLALALYFAAVLRQLRREAQATQERAEALITLSSEQGFVQWLPWGTILGGWMLAEQGYEEEGIAQVSQGLAAWRATGAEIGRPHQLGLLIETYLKVGHVEEGLAVLAEALDVVNRNGERFSEAELYRLKGELLMALSQKNQAESASSSDETAETYFHQALDVSRRQGAKSLELRVGVSLSRLWQQQGKIEEARKMLSEIYVWFTEGFDTADLKEAKALLEKLS